MIGSLLLMPLFTLMVILAIIGAVAQEIEKRKSESAGR